MKIIVIIYQWKEIFRCDHNKVPRFLKYIYYVYNIYIPFILFIIPVDFCGYGGQEVSQSADLPGVSQRTRKANGVVIQPACLRRERETMIKSLSLKAQRSGAPKSKGRKRWMSQLNQRKWICPSSTFLFCSIPQWIRWCLSALERGVFTHSTDSNANVFQRYFTDILRNNVYQLSGQKKRPKSRQWGHMEWDLFPRRDDRYSLQAWTGDTESINQWNCVKEQNLYVTRNPSGKWRPESGTYLPTISALAFFFFFCFFRHLGWEGVWLNNLSYLNEYYPCSPSWSDQKPHCHFFDNSLSSLPNFNPSSNVMSSKISFDIYLSIFTTFSPFPPRL